VQRTKRKPAAKAVRVRMTRYLAASKFGSLVSYAKAPVWGVEERRTWPDGVATLVCTGPWSPATLSLASVPDDARPPPTVEGLQPTAYRRRENFAGADLAVGDVDGGLALVDAAELLRRAGYAFMLLPTRNHQKVKDGKPACDRYRVLLLAGRRILTPEEHAGTFDALDVLLGRALDKQARDVARFYFPSTGVARQGEGKAFPVVTAAPAAPVHRAGPWTPRPSSAIANPTRYAAAALLREADKLGSWPAGGDETHPRGRNAQAFAAARRMAAMEAHLGVPPWEVVEERLTAAGLACGLEARELAASLNSGHRKGLADAEAELTTGVRP